MNEMLRLRQRKFKVFPFHTGAVILGPRVDRFRSDESKYISGHSIPLISLGGFILTFGFMAFNAGSQVPHSQKIYNILPKDKYFAFAMAKFQITFEVS